MSGTNQIHVSRSDQGHLRDDVWKIIRLLQGLLVATRELRHKVRPYCLFCVNIGHYVRVNYAGFLPEAEPTGLVEGLAKLEGWRRKRRSIKPGKIYVRWAPEAFGSQLILLWINDHIL